LGGIFVLNNLLKHYPAFTDSFNMQIWIDVDALVVDAMTTNVITLTQYNAFQTAFDSNGIPVTLPPV